MNEILKRWNSRTDDEIRKANPHLSHLVGKSMDELKKMFPLANVCDSPTCEFSDIDHAIFMEYDHNNAMMAKKGMIMVSYRMNRDNLDFDDTTKIFSWWNGEKWMELKQ